MKVFGWLAGFFVFLLILAIVAAFYFYPRIPHYLGKDLSERFEVPVTVQSVDLSWNEILIKKIDIANPPRVSRLSKALTVETTTFTAPLPNYLKDHIVIDEIHLDNIYASIEFYDKKNQHGNWTVLIDNLDKNEHFGASERGDDHSDDEGTTVLIKKLILTNITIDLARYDKSIDRLSPIKRLEFDNVSTEKGFPTEEITEIIIQKMLEQIFSLQGLTNMFTTIITTPATTAGDILKGIFGGG